MVARRGPVSGSGASYSYSYGNSNSNSNDDYSSKEAWAKLKRRVFWVLVIVFVLAGIAGLVVFIVSRNGDNTSEEGDGGDSPPGDGSGGGGDDITNANKDERGVGPGGVIGIVLAAIAGVVLVGTGIYKLRAKGATGLGLGSGSVQPNAGMGGRLSIYSDSDRSGSVGTSRSGSVGTSVASDTVFGSDRDDDDDEFAAPAPAGETGGILQRLSRRFSLSFPLASGSGIAGVGAENRGRSGTDERLENIARQVNEEGPIRKEGEHPQGTLANPLPSIESPELLAAISEYRKAELEQQELQKEADRIAGEERFGWKYYENEGNKEEKKKLMRRFAGASDGKYRYDESGGYLVEVKTGNRATNPAGLLSGFLGQDKAQAVAASGIKERQKENAARIQSAKDEIDRITKEESRGASGDFTALKPRLGEVKFETLTHAPPGRKLEQRSMVVYYGDAIQVRGSSGKLETMYPVFRLSPGSGNTFLIHNTLELVTGAREVLTHLSEEVKKGLRVMKKGEGDFSLWFHDGGDWVNVIPEIMTTRAGKRSIRIKMEKNGAPHSHPDLGDRSSKTFVV